MNDNGNKYALAALKEKRACFAGEIIAYKKKINWRQNQIRNIDAAIEIFEPGFDVDGIKSKRPRRGVTLFKQGELGRMILDILRRSGKPISRYDLVTAIIALMGHNDAARPALAQRVRANLAYQQREGGPVRKVGVGKETRWTLIE